MKKAALIVGARPQFIKSAPLILELGRFYKTVLIHTGQHFDFSMSELFFDELKLPTPDYHLNTTGGSSGRQTAKMIEGLESVLAFEKPDFSVVVGDTNSTLAGAVVSAKLNIPIVHVEAGVRSKDKNLPEQINRVVTDSIADCFLCPTQSAVENLKKEGKVGNLYDTGDIIYDCLRIFEKNIPQKPSIGMDLPDRFILATLHRAEAVDNPDNLSSILRSLSLSSLPIILPLHPRTSKMIDRFDMRNLITDNILAIEPVGYLDILSLLKSCEYVVTDSGGVQREAVFLGKGVILPRPETEWIEFVESGWIKVRGYDFEMDGTFDTSAFDCVENLLRPAAAEMIEKLKDLF
ncbi:MAG: UDP-N-acetylglucosamine 2-epimerase (non-hydrolyzing) [candidate division Zixibacteria bacterium]